MVESSYSKGIDIETEPTALRRGLLLITALLAAIGGGAIYILALPALWRMSWPYGLLFTGLGLTQLGLTVAVLVHPERQRVMLAAVAALIVVLLWGLARLLPSPDPWVPVNSVIGFTYDICAGLQAIAAVGLMGAAVFKPVPHRSLPLRVFAAAASTLLAVLVVLGIVVGVMGSSDGFAGAGFPPGIVAPQDLPAGQMSTVEYCRPDGVPLAMDLYMPPATALNGGPAPAVIYIHGGGAIGDRKMYGFGANLANHQGALFTPLQKQLNARGFVVASIDFRLPPGTPWPAPIEDAKCAVRFLRAHATSLGIDSGRIGVWGSSSGGYLGSLLGLIEPGAGFDRGQYLDQSSAVQAVVDMFGPADLTVFNDSAPFGRFMVQVMIGSNRVLRRSASPITYVNPSAPPFLILQGNEDRMVPPHQSADLAQRLRDAGVSTTLIEVQGTGHTLDTPGEQPSASKLTSTVIDFFVARLK
jgi:acetyl esterase/lipase